MEQGQGAAAGASAPVATTASSTGVAVRTVSDASGWDPAEPHGEPIPSDAIRLRIIANSDSPADQALKEAVRDKVVTAVAVWLRNAKTPDQARAILVQHLPQIREIAQDEVRARGAHYGVRADVGRVPFPTKVYGNMVYPAGEYEALRITLGAGQGQNWWCVLFPPLCFIEIADGDAVPNTGGFPDLPPLETLQVPTVDGGTTQVQVRVAALDYGEALWRTLRHWLGA
ncbi:MAG: stage II sporulation protein R [Thermoflavifilum sp.]|nr:stage II sporulation protein R [Thermoflavifilum sp.]MCL6513174.1 stage II sporulation protein R [Alicyclobacillus sp.]